MNATQRQTRFAFLLITSLFFLWGFANNLNPILIPHLKKSFTLNNFQATLVDSAVYIAYFLMALPAGFLIKKVGYKYAIIIGLMFFAAGVFLFIPAANTQLYTFFLAALFIIACGLAILETAANPYASALGNPDTSTQRLNLAQSFNGLAAALAPVIGARVILTKGYTDEQLLLMTDSVKKAALASEAQSVKTPYLILGIILVTVAFIFMLTKLPRVLSNKDELKKSGIKHVFSYRHLVWSIVAQFFYVGAQVCVFSLFILYATNSAGISQVKAAYYLGACGIAFLAGRFIGTYIMKYVAPNRLLAVYAVINSALCLAAIFTHGLISLYAVVLICFFMSIMFPTIFALGIKNLGSYTEYGSSLLIMSIVGGALIPPVFAYIGDMSGNIKLGYIVPFICFIFIWYFGWRGFKVTDKNTETINA